MAVLLPESRGRRRGAGCVLASMLALGALADIATAQQPNPHWAFSAPVRPPVPAVRDAAWPRNPIDHFVLAELEAQGLTPAGEADRPTLIRRLCFALTGLPPTPDQVARFVHDASPDAYDRLVDALLASPHYGERLAQHWLDLARYADTNGYHIDGNRDMWMWRDWVVEAFNRNVPFDRFTIQQLAGDLLPDRTTEDLIATGFNRNNMTNVEGGADPAEYAVRYVVDRVNTTATVWLGLTLKCAECHDHKYDPLTQRDYYRFYAFFNNVPERGLDGYYGNAAPALPVADAAQAAAAAAIAARHTALRQELERAAPALDAEQRQWEAQLCAQPESRWLAAPAGRWPLDAEHGGTVVNAVDAALGGRITGTGATFVEGVLDSGLAFDGSTTSVDCGRSVSLAADDRFTLVAWAKPAIGGVIAAKMKDTEGGRGFEFVFLHGQLWLCLAHQQPQRMLKVVTTKRLPPERWYHVAASYDGSGKASGVQLWLDGVRAEVTIEADALDGPIETDESFRIGRREIELPFQGVLDEVKLFRRTLTDAEIEQLSLAPVRRMLAVPEGERTEAQRQALRAHFRERVAASTRPIVAELAVLDSELAELIPAVPTTMIMLENPMPQPARLLARGDYRRPGESLTADVPAALPPLPLDAPRNRLGLAQWLVDPVNPLAARVAVNRLWEWTVGQGLVRTGDDFGTRGQPPTHPALLDWLAAQFVDRQWDVKAMVRLIVMSATFRQTSVVPPPVQALDPDNRRLARGNRLRLDAEAIRDNALQLGGLLELKLGGPGVRPYQPAGQWEEIAFGGGYTSQSYQPSTGADQYRRGLYVYWKRSSPYATFALFDAPTREVCTAARSVTNTPLQALALLNDPVYVEAARGLAVRMLTETAATDSDAERLAFGVKLCWARAPRPGELEVLQALLDTERRRFAADPDAAAELLAVGDYRAPADLTPAVLAAWAQVASALLNASTTVTRG